ncbi:MAG: T9SS type A sorting domain-containing protein [Ginsengibacter sp.]
MRSIFATGNPGNSFLNSSVCDSSLAAGGPLPEDTNTVDVSLAVYPNPFINQVIISSNDPVNDLGKTKRLFDLSGRVLRVQILQSQKTTVNISNFTSGIYILKVEGGSTPLVFKLGKINRLIQQNWLSGVLPEMILNIL